MRGHLAAARHCRAAIRASDFSPTLFFPCGARRRCLAAARHQSATACPVLSVAVADAAAPAVAGAVSAARAPGVALLEGSPPVAVPSDVPPPAVEPSDEDVDPDEPVWVVLTEGWLEPPGWPLPDWFPFPFPEDSPEPDPCPAPGLDGLPFAGGVGFGLGSGRRGLRLRRGLGGLRPGCGLRVARLRLLGLHRRWLRRHLGRCAGAGRRSGPRCRAIPGCSAIPGPAEPWPLPPPPARAPPGRIAAAAARSGRLSGRAASATRRRSAGGASVRPMRGGSGRAR